MTAYIGICLFLLSACTHNSKANSQVFIGDFVYPGEFYRGFIYNRIPHEKLPPAVIGKDGWFYIPSDVNATYRGKFFSDAELAQMRSFFEKLRRHADSKDIKTIFFMAPTNPSIYPEFLTETVKPIELTAVDQFVNYLDNNGIIDVCYPKDELLSEKWNHKLYYKTDPHWMEIGAFFGMQELMKHVSKWFPSIKLHKFEEYKILKKRSFGDVLPKRSNVESFSIEDRIFMKSQFVKDEAFSLPKALVIHDSYYFPAEKFIRENFNIIFRIHLRYDDPIAYHEEKVMTEIVVGIDAEKPDIVIFLFSERGYDRLFNWRNANNYSL